MPAGCCIDSQLGKYALDFLRIDTRPTFVVFVPDDFSADEKAEILFANDALRGVERRGELPRGWVLSEGFLRHGGGRCFPNSRWRFTAVKVGESVAEGNIMVVTAEWGGDVWERKQDERVWKEAQLVLINGNVVEENTKTRPAFRETKPPTLALAVSGPSFDMQLSGPVMDWTREDSPLYSSQHYRNLRNVDWYLF